MNLAVTGTAAVASLAGLEAQRSRSSLGMGLILRSVLHSTRLGGICDKLPLLPWH